MRGIYQHYSGRYYLAIGTGFYTGNDPALNQKRVVLYYSLYDNDLAFSICVRPLSEWNEEVMWPDGRSRSRFRPVSEMT